MYNVPLNFCQWNKIERRKTESESKPFNPKQHLDKFERYNYRPDFCVSFSYFLFFQKDFQIIKNKKKEKKTKKEEKQMLLGHCQEKNI